MSASRVASVIALCTLCIVCALCTTSALSATSAGLANAEARPSRISDWPPVWRELDRLRELAPQSQPARALAQELETLSAERERAARKVSDRVEAFRARVLHAQLARIANVAFQPLRDPNVAMPWLPGEARRSFEVLGPCPTRPQAWLAALTEISGVERAAWLKLGVGVAHEELAALRLDSALAVAKALVASADDASHAVLLAHVCVQGEHWSEALSSLEHGSLVANSDAEREDLAWSRALLEQARGDRLEAQRWLGAGLALGSPRSALALANQALFEGDNARSRVLLRPWLDQPELERGAWRSYALALLPTLAAH